ncbi:MAG TPA: hypothetical protein VEY91_03175 [Candidatus Limnocylindria bacterium]|nr:hypothetical protein [Candidatus Limnocylindria bacterium]
MAALRVRDLVVALGGKTAGVPTRTADDLELQISEVTAVTEKIRGHAAAGEIDGVTAQNTALQGMITKMLKTSAQ